MHYVHVCVCVSTDTCTYKCARAHVCTPMRSMDTEHLPPWGKIPSYGGKKVHFTLLDWMISIRHVPIIKD